VRDGVVVLVGVRELEGVAEEVVEIELEPEEVMVDDAVLVLDPVCEGVEDAELDVDGVTESEIEGDTEEVPDGVIEVVDDLLILAVALTEAVGVIEGVKVAVEVPELVALSDIVGELVDDSDAEFVALDVKVIVVDGVLVALEDGDTEFEFDMVAVADAVELLV
jgi:hypothetical protein